VSVKRSSKSVDGSIEDAQRFIALRVLNLIVEPKKDCSSMIILPTVLRLWLVSGEKPIEQI